jgi:chromosome segregation ATPase
MRIFLIFLILLAFAIPANAATIYKWVDERGVVNFTDDYSNVPSSYRDQVAAKDYPIEGVAPSYSPPQKKMEPETGIYGRDEAWRRDKTDLWEAKLNEATENYERVRKEFAEKEERLVQVRYGSKTQYQMISYTLSGLRKQMEEYRAQIAEAKEMLDKLSKEAEREKAGPGIAPTAQETASAKREKITTDLYGRDQAWWEEKVRPWKEQLKEATQNYEKVQAESIKKGEELGPPRFGRLSLTQYQMVSTKETVLSDQMAKYQAQIAEAREMLEKLAKEAREADADPAWLD